MTDIDFDELDRAVSSLMDQHNAPAEAPTTTPAPAASPTDQPSADLPVAPVVDTPAADTPQLDISSDVAREPNLTQTARVAATPTPDTATPIVQRRGRFMDVIPSTNGRAAAERPAPSTRPSREATPLQPTAEPISNTPDVPTVQEEAPVSGEGLDAPVIGEELAPLESPFIEGVAVDKRPLGTSSFADSVESEAVATEPAAYDSSMAMPDPMTFGVEQPLDTPADTPATDDPWDAEAKTDTPTPDEPLRPELSPEVLAVESSEFMTEAPVAVSEPAPSEVSETAPALAAMPEEAPQQSGLPGNINPQYTAAPADAPEPSGIFEAAADTPQPLAHPEKKKSGWMVIVWIALLVVIGAAGGVAAWYFLLR